MKWTDYREKLGIGFNDEEKASALLNKYLLLFDSLNLNYGLHKFNSTIHAYFNMVCEYSTDMLFSQIQYSFSISKTSLDLLSKCVAFLNCAIANLDDKFAINYIKQYVFSTLEDLSISYELITDDEGYFIFPKGAKELDDALVSEPLEWLSQYPTTRKLWIEALKLYVDTNNSPTDIADKFRKALEDFFQAYFGGGKTLENYKSDYGTKLKSRGVPKELINNFETLLQSYTNFMNSYAKHHDKTERNVLEYIMYQTGNIIRLLITLNQEEK